MADSDKVILLKIEVAQAQANANVKKLEASLNNLDGRTKEYRLTLKKLQLERAKLANLRQKDSKSISNYANELGNANKQTGAATSATLEFGRVLSDAPYGIRGVANNLQQLASNLFFMSKGVDNVTGKTIGFKGAIGSLIKNLAGPAGLLVAFQGATALLDYFSTGTKEAEASTSDFESSLISLTKTLDDLYTPESEIVSKVEEYIKLNTKRINIDKNLKKNFEELSDIENELASVKESLADAIESESKAENDFQGEASTGMAIRQSIASNTKLQTKLEAKQLKITLDSKKLIQDKNKITLDYNSASEGTVKALEKIKSGLIDEQKTLSASPEKWKQYSDKIKDVEAEIEKITGKKNKGKKTNLSPFDTPEELELKIKSTLDARQKLAQQSELINLKTEENEKTSMTRSEEDKTFIKEEYARRRLDITEKYEKKAMNAKNDADIKSAKDSYNTYIKKIDKEVIAFEAKLRKDGKALTEAEQKMLTDAKKVASDKKENAQTELTNTVILIESEYGKLFPFWQQMAAARRAAIGTGKKVDTEKEFTLEEGLQQYMKVQSAMTNFMGGEFDRQLTIEQNKTNALNNELNQRLLNENLSKDERERIQLQIGRNDEKLRKKQEAIEKKRFKLNKAANIANATINTYLGATQVLSSKTIPDVAKPFVMAATIASGLLQVAQIARQKFQSSAGSGGSIGAGAGGAGGGEGREFNFNLAGSTQSNQLTQSIAGQLSQPIQAYVVSSEMTSQQQLDLSISNTATIG